MVSKRSKKSPSVAANKMKEQQNGQEANLVSPTLPTIPADEVSPLIWSHSDKKFESKSQKNTNSSSSSSSPDVVVLFAHGAGADANHEWMGDMASRLTSKSTRDAVKQRLHNEKGNSRKIPSVSVCRFHFPYMMRRQLHNGKKYPPDREPLLLAGFHAAVAAAHSAFPKSKFLFAGKSLGSRMAAVVTAPSHRPAIPVSCLGVVAFGFPFFAANKDHKKHTERVERLRSSLTENGAPKMLILQGENDSFGAKTEQTALKLPSNAELHWLRHGSHDLTPTNVPAKEKGTVTKESNLQLAAEKALEFIINNS